MVPFRPFFTVASAIGALPSSFSDITAFTPVTAPVPTLAALKSVRISAPA